MIHGIQSTRFVRAERQPEHRMTVATALFSLAIHQCASPILEVLAVTIYFRLEYLPADFGRCNRGASPTVGHPWITPGRLAGDVYLHFEDGA
jgi:hypothetical protein